MFTDFSTHLDFCGLGSAETAKEGHDDEFFEVRDGCGAHSLISFESAGVARDLENKGLSFDIFGERFGEIDSVRIDCFESMCVLILKNGL